MAKSSNINPMEAERRKQKAREIKKSKELKQQQKIERLKTTNPVRLERRINELEEKKLKQNGHLGPEERVLEGLKRDLVQLRKLTDDGPLEPQKPETENVPATEDIQAWGKESVFYDPEWNPLGKAPEGFANVKVSSIKDPHHYEADPEAVNIPLPKEPKPKFYKTLDDDVKTTYESKGSASGKSIRAFVPTSVKRKIDQV